MNGRVCQFCEKPLSRFSIGSGGDFCSREHRNQFRLRLGMDRLQEANKVASLMRRRENAKVIPATQLARDSQLLPRIAPHLPIPVRPPAVLSLRLRAAAREAPHMVANSRPLLPPFQAAAAIRSAARALESAAFFTDRQARPFLPASRTAPLRAGIAAAGAVAARRAGRLAAEGRRAAEVGLRLRLPRIGDDGIQVRPLQSAPQNCREPQRLLRLNSSADRGRELRVSGGIGFRLPALRIHPVPLAGPRTTSLVRATGPRAIGAASRPRNPPAGTPPAMMRFAVRDLLGPTPPRQASAAGFHWPDAIANGPEFPRQAAAAQRLCGVDWLAPVPAMPRVRHENGVARLRPPERVPSLAVPQARGIKSMQRLTLVAFQPPETPFECAPTALYGSLVSGMHFGAAPARKADPAPATLEEHFDAGLQNWVGGTGDWKVDVAGVRTGSLALYSPSLELPGYLLEFLTRIESRGVTWVFRAANLADYYQATLAMAPGGGYELRRGAVTGGAAEPLTVRPVTASIPPGKTAVTVRTRVAGNVFTVSLDGQAIDTWTDSRLTSGGIGFVSAPEERARLYWVKVSPLGGLSKE